MAHLMREVFPQFWLRIHSLPESKRHPESEAERKIIFDRYARFGSALLGEGAPCVMIRSHFVRLPSDKELVPELDWMRDDPPEELMPELDWTPVHRVREDDEAQNGWLADSAWDSWAAPMTWDATSLHILLLDVAENRTEKIVFLSETTDCVFAPYDGGADGFSFDIELLKRLSHEFAPWRSAHPSGL